MNGTDPAHRLRYVYAVGRAGPRLAAAAERAGTSGVAGAGVRTVCEGGLGAMLADVPAEEFGADGLRAQLDDLERLEAVARAHHAVVDGAFPDVVVLPMRLATVYVDDARVAAMLRERAAEFDDLLTRLDGHLEWGVKVYADARQPAAVSAAAAPAPDPARDTPGRAYLRQRRAQRDGAHAVRQHAHEVATRVLRRAGGLASAQVAHRPQQGALAAMDGGNAGQAGHAENIANHAFLVPVDRAAEFAAAVSEAARAEPGIRVEVTGPWAPYSFAQQASEEVRDGR